MSDVKSRLIHWNGDFGPMSEDDNPDMVAGSWLYEYAFFNLVSAYKHFDFEKNDILFIGH